jgi:hypothetical protein
VIAVKDSFDVVPIGVEDEGGVVPGVIARAQPGSSVVCLYTHLTLPTIRLV